MALQVVIDGLKGEIEIPDLAKAGQRSVCMMALESVKREVSEVNNQYNSGTLTEAERDKRLVILDGLYGAVWDVMEAAQPVVIWDTVP